MRSIFFLFIFLFISFSKAYTQNISVELSIEWKKDFNFPIKELKNYEIHPAFLNIIYRNISDKPLYCLKIAGGKAGLPEIILLNIDNPFKTLFPKHDDNYFKRRYFVGFKSCSKYYDAYWDISNDTTDIEFKILKDTWEQPVICGTGSIYIDENTGEVTILDSLSGKMEGDTKPVNDWLFVDLDGIYSYIYSKIPDITSKEEKERWYHYSSDITSDTIMNNSIDKFVFLKPGETYVDKYNLIGFQITGGTFTFQLDDTKSLDYVETEPVVEDDNKFGVSSYQKKQLPKKVGEYELFSGEFLTNKVSVQFPGIKRKE